MSEIPLPPPIEIAPVMEQSVDGGFKNNGLPRVEGVTDEWWIQNPVNSASDAAGGEKKEIQNDKDDALDAGELVVSQLLNKFSDDCDVYNPGILQEKSDAMRAELEKNIRPEDANTFELFKAMPPVYGLRIDGKSFFLSQTVSANGREHCIGYVELENGQVAPRLFYRSNSDGDWRVSPYYERWQDANGKEKGYYSKGDTMKYGYVRETRLVDDLRVALEKKSQSDRITIDADQLRWLTNHFSKEALGATNTYEDEAYEVLMGWGAKDKGIFEFVPGEGFQHKSGKPAGEIVTNIEIPDMIKPDFSQPVIGIRISHHPILGQVITEQIPATNGTLVWNFSRDSEGRVWVSGIVNNYLKKPNSYGTDNEVFIAGILDNKPIEYKSQVEGLKEGKDYKPTKSDGYVDITPLLDRIPVINEYRKQRQVERIAA